MYTVSSYNKSHHRHDVDDVETIDDNAVERAIWSYCYDCDVKYLRFSTSIVFPEDRMVFVSHALLIALREIALANEFEWNNLPHIISFDGFDHNDYYNGEQNILKPRLEALGCTNIHFYRERDAIGPFTECYFDDVRGYARKAFYA